MVVKHTMARIGPSHLNRRPTGDDGETSCNGVQVYMKAGETVGEAYARQLKQAASKPKPVAKPVVVDPRLTELRKLQGEVANAERRLAMREAEEKRLAPLRKEHAELKAEHARLQQQLAERDKPRKGVRFSQGGFNAFKKPAA